MEIQHQHHHDHPQHKEKVWTHYALEFFMLFLAVTCGFLAENFREQQVDKEREKVYIKNLCEDLKADTTIYSAYQKSTVELLGEIDSLITLMKSSDRDAHMNEIYFVARMASTRTITVFPNPRTFNEMEHAGNLRLIRNHVVADSISYYYNSLKILDNQNLIIGDRLGDYMHEMSKVFDAQILYQILKDKKLPALNNLKLITNDAATINGLLVIAQYFYGSRMIQNNRVTVRSNNAKRLLALIQKEYHLE